MDVAGIVVGLSGLISVFQTACEIWTAIGAAKDFGEDIDGAIRKLEIEFLRFHSWWTVTEKLGLQLVRVSVNV
jgi:Prion-inhibition and propagation